MRVCCIANEGDVSIKYHNKVLKSLFYCVFFFSTSMRSAGEDPAVVVCCIANEGVAARPVGFPYSKSSSTMMQLRPTDP